MGELHGKKQAIPSLLHQPHKSRKERLELFDDARLLLDASAAEAANGRQDPIAVPVVLNLPSRSGTTLSAFSSPKNEIASSAAFVRGQRIDGKPAFIKYNDVTFTYVLLSNSSLFHQQEK